MKRHAALAAFAIALLAGCAPSAPPPAPPADVKLAAATPAEQVAILAALMPSIQRELDQSVGFKDVDVKTEGDWAWVKALPTSPVGDPIDFSHTAYAERAESHDLDGGGALVALLQREAGAWVVRDFDIGSTDVAYTDWPRKYGAPAELMGLQGAPPAP